VLLWLGHLQRGGSRLAYDRILATRYGTKAIELAVAGEICPHGELARLSCYICSLCEAIAQQRLVPEDGEIVKSARAVGINFGTNSIRA